ncbi:MAG TPA: TraR/DksA C4-type zinc finger protein [Gemmatimonadaceae bacterium]|jgi:DnaK suppressor protein|nr:TraR/DksA C4-type zinc finger protein [Gemmatimonadaceae bacterium]
MDIEAHKRKLIGLEKTLSGRVGADALRGREQTVDSPADAGDASVADEAASEDFTEAELSATVLRQVRDALHRIDDGTYGRCLVDGGAIEAKRLDAVPWAAYCLKHQKLLEAASRPTPPTL